MAKYLEDQPVRSPYKRSHVYEVYLARRNDRPVLVRVCAHKAKKEGEDGVFNRTPSDHQPAEGIKMRLEESSSIGGRRALSVAKGKKCHLRTHNRHPVMTRDDALGKTGEYQPFAMQIKASSCSAWVLGDKTRRWTLRFRHRDTTSPKSPTANETNHSSLATPPPSR